jgi:hypothetical protein
MKMSDVWGWDAIPQNYGHYTKEQIANYQDGDYYGFLFFTEEAAEGVAHAVRNHDSNIERIKELEEALRNCISEVESYICDASYCDVDTAYKEALIPMSVAEASMLLDD